MEATIHSMQSELDETIQHRMESIMSCVEQKMQDLQKELTKTWVELQELKTSLSTWTENFQEARKPLDLKANPEEIESEMDHREVPKECAVVKLVDGLRKQHRGRNLGCRTMRRAKGRCPAVQEWHGARNYHQE
jgi:gas vesicle protein